MKKLKLMMILGFATVLIVACQKQEVPPQAQQEATLTEGSVDETEVKEQAPYELKGNTVQVNNAYCAVSHSYIKPEDRGTWKSTVVYEGQNQKFQGKTFVFNQCCAMCIKQFDALWKEDPDKYLSAHGIE